MAAEKTRNGRLEQEAERIAQLKQRATAPASCGPDIVPMAPGRGAVRRFQPGQAVITEAGHVRVTRAGHLGRDALARADAFDVMLAQSARRRPSDGANAKPLFTTGQIMAGRDYAVLAERYDAAGVRCSSVEALGGGGQGSFIDAVIQDGRRLAWMRDKIGDAVVLSPRGAAAHSDRGRRIIRTRHIVDAVCIEGLTISQLLQSCGWPRTKARVNEIRQALAAALDRMRGFRDQS